MEILLIGIVGGLLSGLLGIGGGSIFVPALVFFTKASQATAQGVALAIMIPTSLLGGMIYFKNQLLAKELLRELILGGIIGALLGSTLANHLPGEILRKFFALVLFYFGLRMLWKK